MKIDSWDLPKTNAGVPKIHVDNNIAVDTDNLETLPPPFAVAPSLTGACRAPPAAPPAWQTCIAAEDQYCPGEAGNGKECCSCVAKNHAAFTAAGCLNNFTNTTHPAVGFCHVWCKT